MVTRTSFVSVVFNCYHTKTWRAGWQPKVNEWSWCELCVADRMVTRVNSKQWKITCLHCPYSRRYGEDETNAKRSMAHHGRMKPTHTMVLEYTSDERHTDDTPATESSESVESGQGSLSFTGDEWDSGR